MFRILIRYVTLTYDDAFSSVDECDGYFFKEYADFSNNILYHICHMFTKNHRVLHNIFSRNTVYILFISVGCKSKQELHFFLFQNNSQAFHFSSFLLSRSFV